MSAVGEGGLVTVNHPSQCEICLTCFCGDEKKCTSADTSL